MEIDPAKTERDRRLRRRMLSALGSSIHQSPTGGLSGQALADIAGDRLPDDQAFEDDGHAMRLMRELATCGFTAETIAGRRIGQRFGLGHVAYRITEKGLNLLAEKIEPHPLVWDERIAEGE